MAAAGLLTPAQLQAWRDIASGAPERVRRGNLEHLRHEQFDVIADDDDGMRGHSPLGPAVTYAMTMLGAPSIPGAHSYPDVFPLVLEQPTPGPDRLGLRLPGVGGLSVDNPYQVTVRVETPLPDGNVSSRDQRWALITEDTLPAYEEMVARDPERLAAELRRPVQDRIDEWRLSKRWPSIVAQLADWDVEVTQ